MPPRDDASNIVRRVIGERGTVAMRTELVVRFGYGAIVPWMTRLDERTLRAIAGPDQVVLRTDVPLHGEGHSTVGDFDVHEGETVDFVLTHCASHRAVPVGRDVSAQLADTSRFWSEWSSQASSRRARCATCSCARSSP